MDDRELLELAAKAIGMKHLIFNQGKTNAYYAGSKEYMTSPGSHTPWNPLTDDGNALRLAVKLGFVFSAAENNSTLIALPDENGICQTFEEPHGTDPYAATRRAIVRAAAEIGKSM